MTSGGISGSSPISIPALKTKLVEKSDSEVRRFWTAIQDGLLPALAKGDSAAAAKSYAEITARYTAHRAIIDDIVKQTNDQNAATEVAATGRVSTFTLLLWGVSAAVFLVIGAGIFGVAFGVIRPDRGNDCCHEGPCRRRPQCFGPGAQPRR
jgi:methyl-accepting chemotaxis protein